MRSRKFVNRLLHIFRKMFNYTIYNEYDQANLLLLQAQGAIGDVRIDAICKLSYEITTQKLISNVHEYRCNKMVV